MRGLLALLLVAVIVAAVGFLADHPGHVEIVWAGWQVDTSAAVLAALFVAVVAVLWGLVALVGGLLRLPGRLRRRREIRRRDAGDAAVTRSLVALAAGDAAAAQREAERAEACWTARRCRCCSPPRRPATGRPQHGAGFSPSCWSGPRPSFSACAAWSARRSNPATMRSRAALPSAPGNCARHRRGSPTMC